MCGPTRSRFERPYIQTHIEATRSAFGLDRRVTETEVAAKLDGRFEPAKTPSAAPERAALGLARLPRYGHADSGAAALLLIRRHGRGPLHDRRPACARYCSRRANWTSSNCPTARTRWINPHFIYTHGYGLVMAEANRITADGLPVLFIQDAPAGGQDAQPEADTSRDLLRGSHSRAGFRAHRAARVQLSVGRGQRLRSLRGQGRVSGFLLAHAHCRRDR